MIYGGANPRSNGFDGNIGMLFIDSATLERIVRPGDLVAPLRAAFASNSIFVPPRTQHSVSTDDLPGTLLIKPAWSVSGRLGVKLATFFPGNSSRSLPSVNGLYVLFSAVTGVPELSMDGAVLTTLRTAAVSALALDLLAPPDASRMLIVGTGALAPKFAQAHASVRAIRELLIWGRTPEKAVVLAERLRREGHPAAPVTDLAAAARCADIVSCMTLSSTPVIRGEWLKDGAHLDLVGSFRPDMREADDQAIAAGGLVVDTDVANEESGDLIEPLRAGYIDRRTIPDLGAVVRGAKPRKGRITIFKSVGTALSDLAAAEAVVARSKDSR